uniref:Uncharacterized protein n=1 Tax=Sphaerodactylus townsendi TaxID=933632 RepID=A0ACB8FHF9_9SAUR
MVQIGGGISHTGGRGARARSPPRSPDYALPPLPPPVTTTLKIPDASPPQIKSAREILAATSGTLPAAASAAAAPCSFLLRASASTRVSPALRLLLPPGPHLPPHPPPRPTYGPRD